MSEQMSEQINAILASEMLHKRINITLILLLLASFGSMVWMRPIRQFYLEWIGN